MAVRTSRSVKPRLRTPRTRLTRCSLTALISASELTAFNPRRYAPGVSFYNLSGDQMAGIRIVSAAALAALLAACGGGGGGGGGGMSSADISTPQGAVQALVPIMSLATSGGGGAARTSNPGLSRWTPQTQRL